MSYEDYRECRNFNLMIEIYNNGGIFKELLTLLRALGIKRSIYFQRLFKNLYTKENVKILFNKYQADETRNIWENKSDLIQFLQKPGSMDAYLSGNFGLNQIFYYRSLAMLNHTKDIIDLAFDTATTLLTKNNLLDKAMYSYLSELKEYIALVKGDLLSYNNLTAMTFHYDFVKLKGVEFQEDPFIYSVPNGLNIVFNHSKEKTEDISQYYQQYGRNVTGLARFLQRAGPGAMSALYKDVIYA